MLCDIRHIGRQHLPSRPGIMPKNGWLRTSLTGARAFEFRPVFREYPPPMNGSRILVRSLSEPSVTDSLGNEWQYHSRSDRHSKIACWGILFDLLEACSLLRSHVARGAVGFGINHEMRDFKTGRKKDLDLVLCTPGSAASVKSSKATFAELINAYGIVLTGREADQLRDYPTLQRVPVGSVHVALEAKACMTAHIKALPRLHDELNSSHLAIHGASGFSIAAGFAMVNVADEFISSDQNKFNLRTRPPRVSRHKQPNDCIRAIEKIREIPRRTRTSEEGFDALGIVVVECRNDKSPVELVEAPPAPRPNDIFHYESMIRRIVHLYENKFSNI